MVKVSTVFGSKMHFVKLHILRKLTSGFLESLRPISIGLPSNEAKAERPIEIGRRLKPAPQAHAVSRSVRKYIRQNVKLFMRQPLALATCSTDRTQRKAVGYFDELMTRAKQSDLDRAAAHPGHFR